MALKIGNNTVIDDDTTVTANALQILGEATAVSYNETFVPLSSSGGSATANCELGNFFSIALSEDVTFTFTNPPDANVGYGFALKTVQDSTARTITWPATVRWDSAVPPTISASNAAVDFFAFITHDSGDNWYGFTAGQSLA